MIRLQRSPLHRGVFILAVTTVALLLSLLVRPFIEPNFFVLFLAAVLASSWYYSRTGGFMSIVLSALVIDYFFLPPVFSFVPQSVGVAVRLATFVLVSATVSWLTASWCASRTLLTATLSSIGDAVIATDRNGTITFVNPVAEALTGWRRAEARGKPLAEVLRLLHEHTREPLPNPIQKPLLEKAAGRVADHVLMVSKDGAEIPIEETAAPIRDSNGEVRGVIFVFRDVTGRRQLEEQLSQAQKMDAVGRLAGGVAGDFNNVLTVITGYSELLRAELSESNPLRRFAEEIMYAAERAAALTRQLLAFSRGQAIQPRLLDLNALISNMEPMLRRMLGEKIDLLALCGPGLGRIKADAAQMEQVIVNLVTNARDAMPDGGRLVIETANVDLEDSGNSKKIGVKPGSYIMLAVSDTGIGMDSATRSRLFEPFFTTKEQGKGSGLGLSAVYGIIKQSEGQITVYSQPACGSIFEIYLPRVTEPVAPAEIRKQAAGRGSETILLVDDEDGVRKLVQAVLKSNGYDVIEASNGNAALAAFEKNAHKIDLVLTDVVMPQMSGFELGQHLAEKAPNLRILYMSGYRDNPTGSGSEVPRNFLHKPFTPDTLLAKIREVLD